MIRTKKKTKVIQAYFGLLDDLNLPAKDKRQAEELKEVVKAKNLNDKEFPDIKKVFDKALKTFDKERRKTPKISEILDLSKKITKKYRK